MSSWEVWDAKGAPRTYSSDPAVGWHKSGRISLNKAAYEALGEPKAMLLLYDRKRGRVGLRSTDEGDPRRLKVNRFGNNSHGVAGGLFRKVVGIPEEKLGRRYEARMEDGVLAFDLDEPTQEEKARERTNSERA